MLFKPGTFAIHQIGDALFILAENPAFAIALVAMKAGAQVRMHPPLPVGQGITLALAGGAGIRRRLGFRHWLTKQERVGVHEMNRRVDPFQ